MRHADSQSADARAEMSPPLRFSAFISHGHRLRQASFSVTQYHDIISHFPHHYNQPLLPNVLSRLSDARSGDLLA